MRHKNGRPRSREELMVQDRLVDRLLDHVQAHLEEDPSLARWAVESVADGLGVAIQFVPSDPGQRAALSGSEFVAAVLMAGRDSERWPGLVRLVVGHVRDALDVVRGFEHEQAAANELEQRWGAVLSREVGDDSTELH